MTLTIRPAVRDGGSFERHDLYGGDEILLRVVDAGDVEVVEYLSQDRDGPPVHSHPWDEVEYVIEGEAEFLVAGTWTRGGPGTVQMLPRGTAHAVRIPSGQARLLMITMGAPYAGLARELSALGVDGYPPTDQLLAVAARHGLRLAAGKEA